MIISDLIKSYRTDKASAYQSLRTMTRNQLLAEARHASREGDLLAGWLSIFADCRDNPPAFQRSWDRLERDILDPALGVALRACTSDAEIVEVQKLRVAHRGVV